jgi:hypothetical protein
MSGINNFVDDNVDKQEKRDPEYGVDGVDTGNDSDGVPSFTALIEEGENWSMDLSISAH